MTILCGVFCPSVNATLGFLLTSQLQRKILCNVFVQKQYLHFYGSRFSGRKFKSKHSAIFKTMAATEIAEMTKSK